MVAKTSIGTSTLYRDLILPKRAKTTIPITTVNNKGPKSEIALTSKLLLVVDPTNGKKPYKPGREKTEYRIAEKSQLSEAFKISKLVAKLIPTFKADDSSNKVIIAEDMVKRMITGPIIPRIFIILFKPRSNVIVVQIAIKLDPIKIGILYACSNVAPTPPSMTP